MIVTQIVVQNGEKKSYCNLCFLKIHKIDDIKLKWLQMRIVHWVIATNVVLKKMGIINCEQCTFCDEKDSIEHLFVAVLLYQTLLAIIRESYQHKL